MTFVRQRLLGLVARTGSQAAGTSIGVNYRSLVGLPALNAEGQTVFFAQLAGTGVDETNDGGIWSEGSGILHLVARMGDQAPGTPSGVNFSFASRPELRFNAAGQTTFGAVVSGSAVDGSNSSGIWLESSGILGLVARAGDHAPGTPSGVNYRQNFGTPVLNDNGQVAFRGDVAGFGDTRGIWSGNSGNLRVVAFEGDEAPGTSNGVTCDPFFGDPVLNNSGQVAFEASLSGNGVSSANSKGIWSEGSDVLHLVARGGSPAPGTPNGVNFLSFASPVLNGAGKTAFLAGLTGSGVNVSNSSGIWSEGFGSLELIAREGNPAPGTPSGVVYGGIGSVLSLPSINVLGQVAFIANLTGSGVDSTNDRGIWATDVDGTVQLIVRDGDVLEVAPSDFRTISSLGFIGNTINSQLNNPSGNEDGRPSGFNDRGQLAFVAAFSDGSRGVFVSNLVAIPEPRSLFLLTIGLIGISAVRSRLGDSPDHRTSSDVFF